MNDYLTRRAQVLQGLFTTTAQTRGRATGFLHRQRRLTALLLL